MMCVHPAQTTRRRGVVLLVVITLLTLFAVVGITFVLFAQSEAVAARVWREAQTNQRPDMDQEMLLAYFLNQFIFGTTNQGSALQYNSLAEGMYGAPGNIIAYNGTGRVHTGGAPTNSTTSTTPTIPATSTRSIRTHNTVSTRRTRIRTATASIWQRCGPATVRS
jgi:hypothetical protein